MFVFLMCIDNDGKSGKPQIAFVKLDWLVMLILEYKFQTPYELYCFDNKTKTRMVLNF